MRPTVSLGGRYVAFQHTPDPDHEPIVRVFDMRENRFLDLGGWGGGIGGMTPHLAGGGRYVAVNDQGGISVFDVEARKYVRLPGIRSAAGGTEVGGPTLSFGGRFLSWGRCCNDEKEYFYLYDRSAQRMVDLPPHVRRDGVTISPEGRYIYLTSIREAEPVGGERQEDRDYFCLYDRGPGTEDEAALAAMGSTP
ncbi:MAG: hypothetical protein HYY13_02930 [Nitrospirae bacterium]|nr:hypothetical protein [Nitrospirota bacterium]